jgi:hypothetical protein
MEMKVIVVTSDKLEGIFSTKENAEKYKSLFSPGDFNNDYEWEVDSGMDTYDKVAKKGYSLYRIVMLKDGTVESCDRGKPNGWTTDYDEGAFFWQRTEAPAYKGKGVPDALNASILARNEKHAIKIANEIRTRMIASGEWK